MSSRTFADSARQSALAHRHVIALRRAGVKLTRAPDLLAWIADHLVPLRDPAHCAGKGEERGEHGGREADRRKDDARIEVHVREQLLFDEVGIAERDFFKAQRGEATIEEWQAKVAEIRSRYPYPQEVS